MLFQFSFYSGFFVSVRKKTVIKMTVFNFFPGSRFYFHFTAWTSGFFLAGLSEAEQPQLPPQPETIAGFNHFARTVQPCFWQPFESELKTEYAAFGKTFLNTTTALQMTKAATMRISIISVSFHLRSFGQNYPK
jgi:hypothetical protein